MIDSPPQSTCPERETLSLFLDGSLAPSHATRIEEHLEYCETCREILEQLTSPEREEALSSRFGNAWNRLNDRPQANEQPNPSLKSTSDFTPDDTREFPKAPPAPDIPGYTLGELIGQGGTGSVYHARHDRLQRDVAIKVLRAKLTPDLVTRFERETKAAGRLEHPHIVRAYDAGEVAGVPWLVMERLDGNDLSTFVSETNLTDTISACDFVRQAALGLQAAHNIGLIHRDIKPSNLMLGSDGLVKVLDLGLVRNATDDLREPADGSLTDRRTILGSLDYMAPEQGRGSQEVNGRTDIYSLGCTLFALLTGHPPFGGSSCETTADKLLAHATSPRPDVRQFLPDVPPELADFVTTLMSVDPEQRPASAAGVADRLEDIITKMDAATAATADSPVRTRSRFVGIGLVLTALLIAFGVIIIRFRDGTEQRIEVDKPVTDVVITEELVSGQQRVNAAIRDEEIRFHSVWPDDHPPFAIAPFTQDDARKRQQQWAEYLKTSTEVENSIGIRLTLLPPAEFQMGATEQDIEQIEIGWKKVMDDLPSEEMLSFWRSQMPKRTVRLTNTIRMSVCEVTIEQYRRVTGADPSKKSLTRKYQPGNIDRCPVAVNWRKAVHFCNRLSELEGLTPYYRIGESRVVPLGGSGYRLPTEAEWEYACRSGSDGPFWTDGTHQSIEHYASFRASPESPEYRLPPVGSKAPNGFGLHDMLGSTAEWCFDSYAADWYARAPSKDPAGPFVGAGKVRRAGGSYTFECRLTSSFRAMSNSPRSLGGIRLVRTLLPKDTSATDQDKATPSR